MRGCVGAYVCVKRCERSEKRSRERQKKKSLYIELRYDRKPEKENGGTSALLQPFMQSTL